MDFAPAADGLPRVADGVRRLGHGSLSVWKTKRSQVGIDSTRGDVLATTVSTYPSVTALIVRLPAFRLLTRVVGLTCDMLLPVGG